MLDASSLKQAGHPVSSLKRGFFFTYVRVRAWAGVFHVEHKILDELIGVLDELLFNRCWSSRLAFDAAACFLRATLDELISCMHAIRRATIFFCVRREACVWGFAVVPFF